MSTYTLDQLQEVLDNQSCHATIVDSDFQHAEYEITMDGGNWYLTKQVVKRIGELDLYIGDVYAKEGNTRVFLHAT